MNKPLHAAGQFNLNSSVISVQPIGDGNVNDTYLISTAAPVGTKAILQRINRHVFKKPEHIIENIRTTASHILPRLGEIANRPETSWHFPDIIPTKTGSAFYLDPQGECWRGMQYIDNTITYNTISNLTQAAEVGMALGYFHRLVFDLDISRLHTTLPGFHTTPLHLNHYDEALANPAIQVRSTDLQFCIKFVENRRNLAEVLEAARQTGQLIPHVTHGDPKLNNFLFDNRSLKAVGLIDLDTLQPGLLHYDIGDCLRSCCNREGEESDDPGRVRFDLDICQAILKPYNEVMAGLLTVSDHHLIYDSIRLISFELGLRFLTDYLKGNIYFKTDRPDHNLSRALIQFALTQSVESQKDAINHISLPA